MDDGDDTRVKDALPEATVEQLRAWFSLPSFQDLEEAGTHVEPAPLTAKQKRQAQIEKVLQHVNPALMRRSERSLATGIRWRRRDVERRPWETPERMISVDDKKVGGVPTEGDWREIEIPRSLVVDLRTCTPQSFLRDLFRPEKSFSIRLQPPWDDEVEIARTDPMAPVRDSLATRYGVGPRLTPSTESIATSRDERRSIMKRPWAESKRAEARQREAELLRKEAEKKAVQRSPEGPR